VREVVSSFDGAGAGGQFQTTLWSVVLQAAKEPSTQSWEALAKLCRTYWYPVYAFLRRQGKSPHDAQDLTQAFFIHLLHHDRLAQVRPEKGRFRSFLLAALKNFLSDQREKTQAQKRGGGVEVISLDAHTAEQRYAMEPVERLDPEKIYERRWAMTLLDRVLERLESEFAVAGKAERFKYLSTLLVGEADSESYATVGKRLGMTAGAVKVAVLRLRQRYRELFRVEVSDTVVNQAELEEEMRHVFAALKG
jgi:RNA polymerase sigma factor (sigma-70 family)